MFPTGLASSSSGLLHAARRQWCNQWSRWGVTVAVVSGALISAAGMTFSPPAQARDTLIGGSSVAISSLPPQAQQTYRLVFSGGPFPYDKDGVVFGNRERQLPRQARGYYHEYTVRTPGARNRGARRIICGGEPKTQPQVCYYTEDHYATFSRIAP